MPSATANQSKSPRKGYARIPASLLKLVGEIDIDLFLLSDGMESPALLREAGFGVTEQQVRDVLADESKQVLVREGDYGQFNRELLGSLDSVVEDDSIDPADRFSLVQTAAAAEVEHACSLANPGKYVSLSQDLGANLATLIESSEFMPGELFEVARHDYHTFSHVTNVSCYVVMLAEAMGIADEEQHRELAIGGMLHDLGKRHIPAEILKKPGRLTDSERRVIEEHPLTGFTDLVEREDLSRDQLMMVYQHHEKVSGGGYPVGVLADEIHPWAKLTAVADVFDAVTGSRPYRDPMPKKRALELLEDMAGKCLDKEVVKCFANLMRAT